jgi:MFS family permease
LRKDRHGDRNAKARARVESPSTKGRLQAQDGGDDLSRVTSDGRSLSRNGELKAFILARTLVTLASLMVTVAVGWQVYELTRSAFALGMVGLVQFVPALLLALPGGLVADRYERRAIQMAGFSLLATVSLLLAIISLVPGARSSWIFPVVALVGAIQAFLGPAGQSILPLLVSSEDFPRALAWNSSASQVAAIAGPAFGGLLYAFGAAFVYAVSAACFTAAVLLLFRVAPRLRFDSGEKPGLHGLFTGLQFVFSRPILLGAISLDLFAVLFGGATALLPIYARDILHVGPWGLGLLRSAPAVGAATMGLSLARRPLRRRAGVRMMWFVALFGAFTIVFGLSRSFLLSLAALLGLGAADTVSMVIRHTMVQMGTPDENRGRVSAVNSVFIGASNQLGEFESGLTAAWFGTVPAAVLGGIGTLVVVGLWAVLFPALRSVEDPSTQGDKSDAAEK